MVIAVETVRMRIWVVGRLDDAVCASQGAIAKSSVVQLEATLIDSSITCKSNEHFIRR